MKNLFIFIIFIIVFVLIFVRSASAQSVEDIIDQYLLARGGLDRLQSIHSITLEGSKEVMNNKVVLKVTKVQGKFCRTDFEFGENVGYSIITPDEGWIYMPVRSEPPKKITAESLQYAQQELDIAGPLVDYKLKGYRATLLGRELVNGKECHKVQLTAVNGKESFYFINIKTGLLVQSRNEAENNAGNSLTETREIVTSFGDYKDVDGILFPQTINTESAGIIQGSITYDKIQVNISVDEKLYKPGN